MADARKLLTTEPSVDLWEVVPGMGEEQTLSMSTPQWSLGAQRQILWLSSLGEDRDDASPPPSACVASIQVSNSQGRLLPAQPAVRCLSTPGNQLWSEDSVHKSNMAVGTLQ